MKNVTLFACLLVLTLGASAQSSRSVGPIAIPANARSIEKAHANANGVTVADHAVSAQSAAAPTANGGPQGPPTQKQPPNAVQVPPTAKK